MREEFDKLVKLVGEVYDGTPWYGPSVKKVLSDMNENEANLKTGKSHSVIELIHHMAAWKKYVAEVLYGNFSYNVADKHNFPKGTSIAKAIEELDMAHVMMLDSIIALDFQKLNEIIPERKYTYYDLLHGIIHHDVYHAGQISLLRKQSE